MSNSTSALKLTDKQKTIINSILEDIFYLESTIKKVKNENLINLSRISIIFNYILLEALRDFYCEKLSITKNKKTKNYTWNSFFNYKDYKKNINLLLRKKQYTGFKKIKDMQTFIDELRIQRNLILHRSSLPKRKVNQQLQNSFKKANRKCIEIVSTKSKNCFEIMNYITELN